MKNRLSQDSDPRKYNCGRCRNPLKPKDDASSLIEVCCPNCTFEWLEMFPGWVECPECSFEFEIDEAGYWIESAGDNGGSADLHSNDAETYGRDYGLLMEMANPDLYRANIFRITGLHSEATERKLLRFIDRRRLSEKYGGEPLESCGPFPIDPAPDAQLLQAVQQRVTNPERRLIDEFFWFWPQEVGNADSDDALMALSRNCVDNASSFWMGEEQGDDDVSTHNLAVLSHLTALDLEYLAHDGRLSEGQERQRAFHWRESLRRWSALIKQNAFWERLKTRIRELDEVELKTGIARQIRATLPTAILSINAQIAVSAIERHHLADAKLHAQLIRDSGFESKAIESTLRRAAKPVCEKIKQICNAAVREAEGAPANGDQIARHVFDQTGKLLDMVNCLLNKRHPLRDEVNDNVATVLRNCLIDFGNETEIWDVCIEMLSIVRSIAVSKTLRERIEKDIEDAKGLAVHQEMSRYVTPVLSGIKEITAAQISPKDKFGRLQRKIVPLVVKARGDKGEDSEICTIASNLLSRALREVSVSLYNDADDTETACKAIRLAARYCSDAALKKQIEEDTKLLFSIAHRQRLMKELEPIKSAPSLTTVNGIGTVLYGNSDYDAQTQSHLTTLYFTILFIPILPIARYRVIQHGSSYQFLGKARLRPVDKWHLRVAAALFAAFLIFIILESVPPPSSKASNNPVNSNSSKGISTSAQPNPVSNSNAQRVSRDSNRQPTTPPPLRRLAEEESPPQEVEPVSPNRLHTGAAPLGYGVRKGSCIVKVINGTDTDALVRVIHLDGGERLYRNFYILTGATFTAERFSAGNYIFKVAFGSDWNEAENRFNYRRSFEKTDPFTLYETTTTEPTTEGYVERTRFSKMTLTLHKVTNGNFHSSPINEAEFWR